jgi:peptide/nickel transport system permease protein
MRLLATLRRQRHNWLGILGAVLLVLFFALAVAGPWLGLPDPTRGDLRARMAAPTISWLGLGAHPLGTDQLGRDIMSRIIVGSRVTLMIAGSAVILGGIIGVTLGLIAG